MEKTSNGQERTSSEEILESKVNSTITPIGSMHLEETDDFSQSISQTKQPI
jgi:hypothetical protein